MRDHSCEEGRGCKYGGLTFCVSAGGNVCRVPFKVTIFSLGLLRPTTPIQAQRFKGKFEHRFAAKDYTGMEKINIATWTGTISGSRKTS